MLLIELVEVVSYAAELQLQAGDHLLAINGHMIDDLGDYHQLISAELLTLEVLKQNNEIWELELEKGLDEDLGLQFTHDEPRQCGNNCIFCFVHQLPKGMRHSLYIKDEDYRFSYLYGSYVTLSNLQEVELQRIITQKISPLYISVHTTDDSLRAKLLGCSAPPILPLLKRLTAGGIELHCQIVLCPGYNGGEFLRQSIAELADLYPLLASLAVVPVGLTSYRERLPQLQKMTSIEAKETLSLINLYQQQYLQQKGSRFVFAADEIYLLAEQEIPELSCYESFSQIENGVGLIAQFRQQTAEVLLEAQELNLGKVTLVTGCSFFDELAEFVSRLSICTGTDLELLSVDNSFFGGDVTVTGLLTGADLLARLQGYVTGDGLLLPNIMFNDEQLLLDGLTINELEMQLKVPVIAVDSSPWGILEGLEKLADGPTEIIHC